MYGDNKFVVTLTDEATKITVFEAVKNKTNESLAYTIFTHWICHMAVPQVIDTNLDELQADELKAELDNYLQQEAPHNPFIDINRGSCYNQRAADLITKTVTRAELSWEDFLPALNLANNTSYQSSIASSPFQLLYGYAPKLPTTNLEAATSMSTLAQERFLTFKRVLETVEKEIIDDKEAATEQIAESFQLNQEVMLSEKSFGQQFWSGPGTIIKIKKNNIELQFGKKKAQYVPHRLCPLTDFQKEEEGYVLKTDGTNSIAAVRNHHGLTQQHLTPYSSPKFQPEAFSEDNEQIQAKLINQP